uniref:LOW QUALITY PROTEIN: GATA zinc finger domain-containing protein 7-like n=1 Tax=Styela clava TaxID=7725 RepID=UPI00193A4835|nr:LOW QUALITY PROTEIN: GATA zinc finger domain-containing protein 7-like [Styela clava]
MKPPKSIRNIVNTLLGKKSKSTTNASESPHNDLSSAVLDKSGRHHRSADDLLDEISINSNSNRLIVSHDGRSKSLPRRSQSCLSVRPSISRQSESIYGRHVVSGLDETAPSNIISERSGSRKNVNYRTRSVSSLPRPASSHSRINFSRNSKTGQDYRFEERDEGFEDLMPRTTSWSHPSAESDRSYSFNFHEGSRDSKDYHRRSRTDSVGSHVWTQGGKRNSSAGNKGIFSSHENLVSDGNQISRLSSSTSSRGTLKNSDATEEKLRTCLQVLDRLSAQVKEIKDVSNRVNYVDNKVKNGQMQRYERERRIRELDIAEAASRRLKSLLKSESNEIPSTRLSSRSSGYDSENSSNSSRLSSTSPDQEGFRSTRPENKRPGDSRRNGPKTNHHLSQPYPQSLSDMMPLWDAKDETSRSCEFTTRRITREDSMSSGYATGSGSEDGKPELDSMQSGYTMHGNNQSLRYNQLPMQNWHQQKQLEGYDQRHSSYDPYSVYGTYPHHSVGNVTGIQDDVYGTYGELYGYAPSSVYDHEVYSNGWFQISNTPQSSGASMYNNQHPTSQGMPAANAFDQNWSQMSYATQPVSAKYGGLSHIFYDPTVQSEVSIIESIAKEVASDSNKMESEDSTWKSYGSFRYRNGQMTVTASGNTNRKRKTVRFSQTVRQRVETEESEVEDSTSVIKGGADETPNAAKNGDESQDLTENSEIYMWPRQPPVKMEEVCQENKAQQKTVHEPIYEFPSGHIESSCMCSDCILARGSCQMQPAQTVAYF